MTESGIDRAKQVLREATWHRLIEAGASPDNSYGKIPEFSGARAGAERLASLQTWQGAAVVKANPDWAQLPVRENALLGGKLLFMAVPKMATLQPFLRLDPRALSIDPVQAADKNVADQVGVRVGPDEMPSIDVVVCGSVAVNRSGARLGKGAGYSDLEIALLIERGLVTDRTVIIAPVHEMQVLDDPIPECDYDVRVDYIVTPEQVIRCSPSTRPSGLIWEHLPEEKITAIPVLRQRFERRRRQGVLEIDSTD